MVAKNNGYRFAIKNIMFTEERVVQPIFKTIHHVKFCYFKSVSYF